MRPSPSSLLRHSRNLSRSHASDVQITTLPNKIRVATQASPGHFSSLGLYVDAGARYETPHTSGVSHFLDKMAFKSSQSRSDEEMLRAIDTLGGQIMCTPSRETLMYQSSHFHAGTPLAMSLIADTVINPSFLPDEIEAQKDAVSYEIREWAAKPEMILPEILHHVAYGGRGLGNPLLCPEERIESITGSLLHQTMGHWFTPDKMVIAGAGMPHQELVELADKYFASLKMPDVSSLTDRLSSQSPSIYKSMTRAASSYLPLSSATDLATPEWARAPLERTYTGGHRFILDPNSEFNHLYLGFEGVGIHDEDIYTLATMQVLLGGGGSFSAGGPGKGMYTRLYTQILNHYHQIDHCASFNHIYADSSLFGLFASFVPTQSRGNSPTEVLPHLVHQLSQLLYVPIPKGELERAKNQLKSSLIMALESRSVEVEDLGRQILVHGRRVPVTDMMDRIDEVTPEAVQRVSTRLFGAQSGRKATVVGMGHEETGDWKKTLSKYGVSAA